MPGRYAMPYHVVIEGEKRGPYPGFRVIELLRDGEVPPDALGWEPGMDAWVKLREIPAFEEAIERIENPPEEEPAEAEDSAAGKEGAAPPLPHLREGNRVSAAGESVTPRSGAAMAARTRPFTRFWARSFDYIMVSAIAWQFCEVPEIPRDVSPLALLRNDGTLISEDAFLEMAKVHYAALILWQVIEGVLVSWWGTTPGKALLGITLGSINGGRLSLTRGLGRSFLVWFAGFGLGLFPFNLLGMTVGIFMLLMTGATLWDRQLGVNVEIRPLTPRRILVAIGAFLLVMILSSLKFS